MKKLKLLLIIPFLIPDFMFAQLASDYYPMHVGDYWIQHTDTMQGEYQPTTFRTDIDGIDTILGKECFRMKQQLKADDGSHDHSPWWNWARKDSTGILFSAFGDTSIVDSATIYDPPILWLSNEMVNLGYTWEFDAPEIGGNFSFKVESISESVQVPVGTFDDCLKIKLIVTNTSGDTTQLNYFYYAEDVGEVLNIGWSEWSGDMQLELIEYNVQLSVDEKYSLGIPGHFRLHQNYPNPFNPATTISYELPKSSFVNMSIYNVAGQLVETLVNDNKSPGYYSVEWNTSSASSGLYFYRIDAGDFSSVKKCLLVK